MPPSLELLEPKIRDILRSADLDNVTAKMVRKQLEADYGSLNDIKKEVDELTVRLVNEIPVKEEGFNEGAIDLYKIEDVQVKAEGESKPASTPRKRPAATNSRGASARKKVKSEDRIYSEDELDDQEESDAAMARRLQQEENGNGQRKTRANPTPTRRAKASSSGGGGGGGGGGFNTPLLLSPALSAFCSGETMLSRPQVVKRIWDYVKAHALQDPSDKRFIVCDDALHSIFNTNRIHMFKLNKVLVRHLIKPEDSVGGASAASFPSNNGYGEDDYSEDEKPRPSKKKATTTKRAAKSSNSSTGKRSSSGFNKPQQLSPELAAVVGTDQLGRPQTVKAIWDYIKANNLQNPSDKRTILCDEKLQRVFGQPSVTMFQMNKLLTPHFSAADESVKEDLKDEVKTEVKGEEDGGGEEGGEEYSAAEDSPEEDLSDEDYEHLV